MQDEQGFEVIDEPSPSVDENGFEIVQPVSAKAAAQVDENGFELVSSVDDRASSKVMADMLAPGPSIVSPQATDIQHPNAIQPLPTEPLVNVKPEMLMPPAAMATVRYAATALGPKAEKFESGFEKGAAETLSGFTTPESLTTMPAFLVPYVGQALALYMGGKATYEGTKNFIEAVKEGDYEKAGRAIPEVGVGLAMLHGGAKSAKEMIKPTAELPPKIPTIAEVLAPETTKAVQATSGMETAEAPDEVPVTPVDIFTQQTKAAAKAVTTETEVKNAIPEQKPNAEVLLNAQPEVGLQEVGTRNPKPKITPAAQTEIPPAAQAPPANVEVRREPRLFRDMSDEDLYTRLQDYKMRWRPGMKMSNVITQMREELAHRAGQPEGTLWGNFGFLEEGKTAAGATPANVAGQFRVHIDPASVDGKIVSERGTLTARASTRENPDGTHTVDSLMVFVPPEILDPRVAPRQEVTLEKPVTASTKEGARRLAYQQFADSLNAGTFKPTPEKALPPKPTGVAGMEVNETRPTPGAEPPPTAQPTPEPGAAENAKAFREAMSPQASAELVEELRKEGWTVSGVSSKGKLFEFHEIFYRGKKVSEADTATEAWRKIMDGEIQPPSEEVLPWTAPRVAGAVSRGEPVPATAFEGFQETLKDHKWTKENFPNYVREGDQYVYRPAAAEAKPVGGGAATELPKAAVRQRAPGDLPPEIEAIGEPPTPTPKGAIESQTAAQKPVERSEWQQTDRGRDIYKSDIATESAKDEAVVDAMKSSPSYPKLLAAYHRFKRSLSGKSYDPSVIEKHPWEMLDSSSGVMNAKSQMFKTLSSLENAVFKESGLPREKPSQRFRGGTGVDWEKVQPKPPSEKGYSIGAPVTVERSYGVDATVHKWPGNKVRIVGRPDLDVSVYKAKSGWIVNADGISIGKERKGVGSIGFDTPEQAVENYLNTLKPKPTEQRAQPEETGPGTGVGPGGTTETDVGTKAQLAQLTDSISTLAKDQPTTPAKAFTIGERMAALKDGISDTLTGLKAAAGYLKERLIGKPQWTSFKEMLGDRHLSLSESAINARRWVAKSEKAVRDPVLREAISNWIDAGGDEALLRKAAEETKPQYRAGYERALRLTPEEKLVAENVKNYFSARLDDAIDAGVLNEGIEDYIHRMYERESPWKSGIMAELRSGIYTGKPALAKQRVFQYDFEAEKAGYKPIKSFIKRVAAYDMSLNKAIADRQAVKAMHEIIMPDGRPMIDVGGIGVTVPKEGTTEATLIKPGWKLTDADTPIKDRSDFKAYDYPALQKWKWVGADAEGNPILLQGDVLVHPDAISQVKTLFEKSKIRQNPVGRAALGVGSTIKQTMLDLSGFHLTQITVHGWEHRTFKPVTEIDFENPNVRGLIRGGLVVGDTHGYELFSEGLAGSSLTRHIPKLGPKLQAVNEWLFNEYIPRLKVATGLHALERNKARFPKLSEDQVNHLTANQMNAAFGELNYEMLGRSKTTQDILRLALLAPDFLEARGRFSAQAATKYGKEQFQALALGAVTLYVTARIVNKLLDDEWHFEPKNAFSIVHNGRAYSLRTVQGDLLHLATDPGRFFFNRLNPVYGRTAIEAATGRDYFGRKRDLLQQIKDFVSVPIPISFRGLLNPSEQKLWESFLNAFGITERRASSAEEIYKLAESFKKEHKIRTDPGEFIYDAEKDPFRLVRQNALYGNVKDTAKAIAETVKKGEVTQAQILKHFQNYASHPFTGSRANEAKFKASLTADQRKIYDDALKERRKVLNNVRGGSSTTP